MMTICLQRLGVNTVPALADVPDAPTPPASAKFLTEQQRQQAQRTPELKALSGTSAHALMILFSSGAKARVVWIR